MKKNIIKKLLTFKLIMRIVAVFVITFLISATILYFYDTLASAFSRLTWHDKQLITTFFGKLIAAIMAVVIGLGVLAESAATIWEKLIYWGQCIDNKIIHHFTGKLYFIDTANDLIAKTRKLVNYINFQLQAITMPTNCDEKKNNHQIENDLKEIYKSYCQIKTNSKKISNLLEKNKALDHLNQQRQEQAKNLLNTLVMENLQISDRIETLNERFKFIKNS